MPHVELAEHHDLPALVAESRDSLRLTLSKHQLDVLAALTYALGQDRVLRRGGVLPARLARPYDEIEDVERVAHRNGVRDVTTALVLLGYLELPE